jgi:hypothetical protein
VSLVVASLRTTDSASEVSTTSWQWPNLFFRWYFNPFEL